MCYIAVTVIMTDNTPEMALCNGEDGQKQFYFLTSLMKAYVFSELKENLQMHPW